MIDGLELDEVYGIASGAHDKPLHNAKNKINRSDVNCYGTVETMFGKAWQTVLGVSVLNIGKIFLVVFVAVIFIKCGISCCEIIDYLTKTSLPWHLIQSHFTAFYKLVK